MSCPGLPGEMAVEPLAGEGEFGSLEVVAGVAPFEGDVGAGLSEQDSEALGALLRDHAVAASGEEKNGRAAESGRMRRIQRKHGTEKNGSGKKVGAEEEYGSGDVGAVRVTHGDNFSEMTTGGLVFDEIGQLVGAANEVVFVEDAGCKTAEETRLSALEDLSARTQQRGAGAEESSEGDKVVFVAAGAMKEEERGRGARVEEEVHEVSSSQWFSIW